MTTQKTELAARGLLFELTLAFLVAACGGQPSSGAPVADAANAGSGDGSRGGADVSSSGDTTGGGAGGTGGIAGMPGAPPDAGLADAAVASGGAGGSGGAPGTGGSGGQIAALPSFVAAGAATLVNNQTALTIASPGGIEENDLVLALVDAWEETGPRTLSAPAGWTPLPGFPIHNKSTEHPPFVIPASENHGTWIYSRIVTPAEPKSHAFAFASATTARGVLLVYRGVDPAAPIHDKAALPFQGMGDTNGLGGGSTTLTRALQVTLVTTGRTDHPTYTVVRASPSLMERFNSGEQPNGLNLVAYDAPITFGIYTGPSIANRQAPSGGPDGFLFTFATLVLKPR
jgi:hypothetical protein